jgi:hypothetical protein
VTRLDPENAAYYALVAICLVLIGALITPGSLAVEARGTVLAGIVTVLFAVAWRARRKKEDDDYGDHL